MSFDETIIHEASPTLCGIKPASLFSMNLEKYENGSEEFKKWRPIFSSESKYFVLLKKNDGRILFFVYNEVLLKKICMKKENSEYLQAKGYPVEKGFNSILAELFKKLSSENDFPHEVGLFLGYPLEDVIGFEAYGASNFKYSGLWKVYGNKENAIASMNEYKNCTKQCIKFLYEGLSVPLVTGKYKKIV